MPRGEIRVGTSGWNYDHWVGPFYPDDVPKKDWLRYYARHFDTVEVNNSFYQLPERSTFERWRDSVGEGFVMAVKGSRYVTHMKKLKDPAESVERFCHRVDALGRALGPLLFQLPPRWRFAPDRLDAFLGTLPADRRVVVEPRDPSWFDPRCFEILRDHGAALCIYDLEGDQSPKEVTADFVYVRLHGPSETAYEGSYDAKTLQGWAGAFSTWARQGKDVYCYFDNDQGGNAPRNALALREMLQSS